MRNTLNIFLFELKYRLSRPATYIYFGILFLLAFLAVSTDVVVMGGGTGKVMKNAPTVIMNIMLLLGAFGMLITSAIMGVPVLRDYEHQTSSMLFTCPITKGQYLTGWFLGSFVVLILVFSGILWGTLSGYSMPWLEQDKLLPFNFSHYGHPFFFLLVPNLLFLSGLFFAGGALSKKMITVYAQGAILLIGYLISMQFISNLDNQDFAALMAR